MPTLNDHYQADLENIPASKADIERLAAVILRLNSLVQPAAPPTRLKTAAAMDMTPYKSPKAFRAWAARHAIRPSDNGRLWDRAGIERALRDDAARKSTAWMPKH